MYIHLIFRSVTVKPFLSIYFLGCVISSFSQFTKIVLFYPLALDEFISTIKCDSIDYLLTPLSIT